MRDEEKVSRHTQSEHLLLTAWKGKGMKIRKRDMHVYIK
jgi:hypothetical protein